MRKLLITGWLMLLPIGGLYHLVAGPHHHRMDAIGTSLQEARQHASGQDWPAAVTLFEQALEQLPEDQIRNQRTIRLELAQAKINAAKLPEAHGELKSLLDELLEDASADADLEQNVRESLANSQFYMTWLMRLEGLDATEWEPEIESARQNYRMLAESSQKSGNTAAAKKQQENLEAAIRLARLDLGDLQGLPLPNQ